MKCKVFLIVMCAATAANHSQFVRVALGDQPANVEGQRPNPITVGAQRQLFINDDLFASQKKITLVRHDPRLEEIAIARDKPWEKSQLHYPCVVRGTDRFQMWYRVDDTENRTLICYAESTDGVRWDKPSLGIIDWKGSRENNILIPSKTVPGSNGVSVIVDADAPPNERYKMVTTHSTENLWSYVSSDGLNWRPATQMPMFDGGRFWGYDSHNVLVWDATRKRYVVFCRGWSNEKGEIIKPGMPETKTLVGIHRVIRRSESADFQKWSDPQVIITPDDRDPMGMDFYTNACVKYDRAQRAWFMFPMVLYEAKRHFPGAPYPGTSDVQFMTSRDGIRWDRRFRHAFIKPGLDPRNWVDRNPIMGIGMVSTGKTELSMYYSALLRSPETHIRRATIRKDGFVSVRGPYSGWGEFTTHPLTFSGSQLEFNYSTSGGGTILVELQDVDGKPLPGFTLDNCNPIFGDRIDGSVLWTGKAGFGNLSDHVVRLHVKLRDADLFGFQFRE